MKRFAFVIVLLVASGCNTRQVYVPRGTTAYARTAPGYPTAPPPMSYAPASVGGMAQGYGTYGQMVPPPPPPVSDRAGTAADPRTHAEIMRWEQERRTQFTPAPPPIIRDPTGRVVDGCEGDGCPVTRRDLGAVMDEVDALRRLHR